MALFRLVNRNVHLNVWFSTVAGKPHRVPVWERGEQFQRIEEPAPLTNDAVFVPGNAFLPQAGRGKRVET